MPTKLQIAGKLKYYSKPYGRQWKWRYQVHGKMLEPKLQVPKALENVKIIDPLHPTTTIEKPAVEKWIPPRRHPLLESFFPQLSLKDHPDYHDVAIKLADSSVRFHAGLDQVCLLTKAKPVNGLPASVHQSIISADLASQEALVKNYIKQALAFSASKEECKGFKPPGDPKFNIATEYGTPWIKQMQILLQNLLRLSHINMYKAFPAALSTRLTLSNVPVSTIVMRGDDLIQIKRNADFAIFSTNPVPAVADAAQIDETVQHQFVDMYPIFPTVDLKEENVYDLSSPHIVGMKKEQAGRVEATRHLHTLVHLNADELPTETDMSRLIMFAFGGAYAQAKLLQRENKLNMDSNRRLTEPIVVNAVSVTHQRFNYVTFQLNTLDLKDNQGVKNLVYYDTNNELYLNRPTLHHLPYPSQKNVQRLALRHLEYNSDVYKKLVSLVTYGSSK